MKSETVETKYSYFDLVYEITRQIPVGRVSSYGAIADYLALGSSRMVGWALNHSFAQMIELPAHRVVNRKGELTGRHHWNPPQLMGQLLQKEGVQIENDKVINFQEVFWHPKELDEG